MESDIQIKDQERFIVNTLYHIEFRDNIIKALIENFGSDGDKYSVIGALTMMELDNHGTARYHADLDNPRIIFPFFLFRVKFQPPTRSMKTRRRCLV